MTYSFFSDIIFISNITIINHKKEKRYSGFAKRHWAFHYLFVTYPQLPN